MENLFKWLVNTIRSLLLVETRGCLISHVTRGHRLYIWDHQRSKSKNSQDWQGITKPLGFLVQRVLMKEAITQSSDEENHNNDTATATIMTT